MRQQARRLARLRLILSNSRSKNARLGLKQALANSAYVWAQPPRVVFNILSRHSLLFELSSINKLRLVLEHLRGNRVLPPRVSRSIFLATQKCRALPYFTKLHSLFYVNKVKIIPDNIYEMLTPVALAHLIMGDGSVQRHGLILCTNSFSIKDVVRLMNVLITRYRLECNLRIITRQK